MTPPTKTLAEKIEALQARGYRRADIMTLTGCTLGHYKYVTSKMRQEAFLAQASELEITARKLLYQVPEHWRGTNEEWRQVVRANFADVLT